jgi:hypothetical protein
VEDPDRVAGARSITAMEKLIILSIVLVSMAVPGWLSTASRPRKALRQTQGIVFVFVLLWGYLCLHWYPDLVPLK